MKTGFRILESDALVAYFFAASAIKEIGYPSHLLLEFFGEVVAGNMKNLRNDSRAEEQGEIKDMQAVVFDDWFGELFLQTFQNVRDEWGGSVLNLGFLGW